MISGSRNDYECSSIDYFSNEEYSPDPTDSTMAIPCKCLQNKMLLLLVIRTVVKIDSYLESINSFVVTKKFKLNIEFCSENFIIMIALVQLFRFFHASLHGNLFSTFVIKNLHAINFSRVRNKIVY